MEREPGGAVFVVSSSPTALDGIVYTGGAGDGGTVYAVSEKNGETLWTAEVENGDSSNPAVTESGVYVSYACPQTYRFNPTTGKQIWHYSGECEGGGGETAAVYQGLVYVRDLYNYATDGITISVATGNMVGGFNSEYMPAFVGTTAFYTEADTLTAVSLTSGDTLWTAVASAGGVYVFSGGGEWCGVHGHEHGQLDRLLEQEWEAGGIGEPGTGDLVRGVFCGAAGWNGGGGRAAGGAGGEPGGGAAVGGGRGAVIVLRR